MTKQEEKRCPEAIVKRVGDEVAPAICRLNSKACVREGGGSCDIYNEWLQEQC